MTATAVTRTVVMEREMPYPQEKIWRALTEGQLMEQWLMSNNFEPEVGRKFSLRTEPVQGWNGIIDCEVLVLEPTTKLSYTWASMGLGTVVAWTLTPTANGTHLRMEQTGFPETPDSYYKGATYGWQKFLGQLETVVGEL